MSDEIIIDETAAQKPRLLGKIAKFAGISSVAAHVLRFLIGILYIGCLVIANNASAGSFFWTFSVVLGIQSYVLGLLAFAFAVAGIITAILASRKAKKAGVTDKDAQLSLILSIVGAALCVLSVLWSIVSPCLAAVFGALAMP